MEVKRSGKIEHSSNTHDDQVFSWLWALYIYYYGGDLMENWGVSKRVLRTDADLEEAVVDIEEDKNEIDVSIDSEVNEEINNQLEELKNAPGRMSYEEFIQSETKKDNECMKKLMMNKAVRKAVEDRYHVVRNDIDTNLETIPDEVFKNFNIDDEDLEKQNNSVLTGNLSKFF